MLHLLADRHKLGGQDRERADTLLADEGLRCADAAVVDNLAVHAGEGGTRTFFDLHLALEHGLGVDDAVVAALLQHVELVAVVGVVFQIAVALQLGGIHGGERLLRVVAVYAVAGHYKLHVARGHLRDIVVVAGIAE